MQNLLNSTSLVTAATAIELQARDAALRAHETAEAAAIAAEAEAAAAAAIATAATAKAAKTRKPRGKKSPDVHLAAIAAANKAEAAATAASTEAAAKAEAANLAEAAAAAKANVTPRAIAKTSHDSNNFFGRLYTGPSATRNNDVAKAPNLHTSKAVARTDATITDRMRATLRELARAYGFNAFPIIGIDRGQAAIFLSSGMLLARDANNVILSSDVLNRYAR